ncbi:hypothetical protein G6F22_020803 [Rhizopus arrhizus]|nr:hypothetical protein G6F22_020803 [Rhizopus arrhizus]
MPPVLVVRRPCRAGLRRDDWKGQARKPHAERRPEAEHRTGEHLAKRTLERRSAVIQSAFLGRRTSRTGIAPAQLRVRAGRAASAPSP